MGRTVGGFVPFGEDPVTDLRTTALPAITLGVCGIARILRTSLDRRPRWAPRTTVCRPVTARGK